MSTATTPGDLARLARTFAARAQPVTEAATEKQDNETEVDVRIGVDLHQAVRLVADYNNQQLTDVARAILFGVASKVTAAQVCRYQENRQKRIDETVAKVKERARKRGATPEEVQQAATLAADKIMRERLPLRRYHTPRYRLRFTVPTEAYAAARDAIQASGRSVAVAVEQGLQEYAKNRRIN